MRATLSDLLRPEVQEYIRIHTNDDEKALVLKNRTIAGVPSNEIAQQIAGRKKAKEKLPAWFAASNILYPPAINLEQCSSESTAREKVIFLKSALPDGICELACDLTSGFGVDSFFLSKICRQLHAVERNEMLSELGAHNHSALGAANIVQHASTAEEFLESTSLHFDFVFADPDRRKNGYKVSQFGDSDPDLPSMMTTLLRRADFVLTKASPLLDLTQGARALGSVVAISVVAVRNECREVLFLCGNNTPADFAIHCININASGAREVFSFSPGDEAQCKSIVSAPMRFLYEPNAAILKAGAFKLAGLRFGLSKVGINTHLYSSEKLVSSFPGRVFEIINPKPELKRLAASFKNGQANIMTRNYPLTPEALKKKYGLKDGGEDFLIGFSGPASKFIVTARKVAGHS